VTRFIAREWNALIEAVARKRLPVGGGDQFKTRRTTVHALRVDEQSTLFAHTRALQL
jgi:hypothetical protein